jgi:hypothetical protein
VLRAFPFPAKVSMYPAASCSSVSIVNLSGVGNDSRAGLTHEKPAA